MNAHPDGDRGEDGDPAAGRADDGATPRAGGYALAFGLLALAFALIPVIGDLVAVPAAVLAIVCGVVGAGHYDAAVPRGSFRRWWVPARARSRC